MPWSKTWGYFRAGHGPRDFDASMPPKGGGGSHKPFFSAPCPAVPDNVKRPFSSEANRNLGVELEPTGVLVTLGINTLGFVLP